MLDWTGLRILSADSPRDGRGQMATDLFLLETTTSPVLRFYHWTDRHQATCGRATDPASLLEPFPVWQWTRRPTGGGLVFHDTDFTLSVILPWPSSPLAIKPRDFYRHFHQAVRDTLSEIGLPCVLTPEHPSTAHAAHPACFQAPVPFDLLDPQGHKLCGGAIRRTRHALLYQGSVRLPPPLHERFSTRLPHHLCPTAQPHKALSLAEEQLIQAHARLIVSTSSRSP
jgi:lipoate-protein ligase A